MIKLIKRIGYIFPFTVVLLTGCGGDDTSSNSFQAPAISTTPVSISQANDDVVADTAFVALESGSSMSDSGDIAGFKAGAAGQSKLLSRVMTEIRDSVRNVTSSTDQLAQVLPIGVVQSATENCDVSGTVSITTNTANVVQSETDISTGDYFTMSANACNDGFDTTNGSLTFTFTDGNQFSDISISFSNFRIYDGIETLTVHGDIRLQLSGSLITLDSSNSTITVSGSSLFFIGSDGDAVHMTNYSISVVTSGTSFTIDSTMTVDSTMIDGRLTITANAITGSILEENPSSGNVEIVGNESRLTVVILSNTQVRLDLDLGNDGSVDNSETVAWTSLSN